MKNIDLEHIEQEINGVPCRIRWVLTKKELIRLNNWAIKNGYHKSLKPQAIEALPNTFEQTGSELRLNYEVEYSSVDNLAPNCERLLIWLPYERSMVPSWLDVKKGKAKPLAIWMPVKVEAANG